jgi:hypothetical protein
VIMTKNSDYNVLEEVVAKAHQICSQLLLFEAIEMEEEEVRLFLDCNRVSNSKMQNAYLELVREYDKKTSSTKVRGKAPSWLS